MSKINFEKWLLVASAVTYVMMKLHLKASDSAIHTPWYDMCTVWFVASLKPHVYKHDFEGLQPRAIKHSWHDKPYTYCVYYYYNNLLFGV